ncbi:MAG TPA: hypothetical protein PK308_04435 [Phycisphaerales bacterium]|jgi:hypothetical protein|nr:hypothetical protein [Phycisphaerales bacterium]
MNFRHSSLGTLALAAILALTPAVWARHGADDRNAGSSSSSSSSSTQQPKSSKPLRLIGVSGNDNTGVKARVRYEEQTKRGRLIQKFDVEISGAAPGSTYNVTIKGQSVGTVTINSLGRGELELRPSPDSPNDQPIPANFPRLAAGSVVQVGDKSVTLRKR